MMKKLYIIPILFILSQSLLAQEPSGRDFILPYYSEALGENSNCRIFLPPGYDANDTSTKYPVIYTLHGAGSGYSSFDLLLPVIDALWASGYMEHFIMAMPDGQCEPFKGSFFTNSILYGNYEDYLYQDLVPFIDANFNTLTKKSFRGIWGFSMGAYGAFKQVFKHPEYFVAVAAHSGPVNLDLLDNLIPDLKEEQGNQPPYDWKHEPGNILTNLMLSMAGAFSPNLEAEYQIDFPLDDQGVIIPEVMERWVPHNIAQIATDLPEDFDTPIYFDCGIQDEFKLIHHNRALSDTLTKYNIQHKYEEYFGNHMSGLIFRIPKAMKFFDDIFKSQVSGIETQGQLTKDNLFVYPNPILGDFKVKWQSDQSGMEATINIMDMMGKMQYTGSIKADGTLNISTDNMAPGLYIMTLKNSCISLSSKIIIN
jgi:enterochelin esterase-like enzyme